MKPFLFFLIVTFVYSCSNTQEEDIVEDGTVLSTAQLDSCDCGDLIIDSSGFYIDSAEGTVFTGVCTDYYPNSTDKYIEKNILEGQLHGNVVYFDRNGKVLMEEVYQEGNRKRSGKVDFLVCDCTELEKVPNPDPQLPNRFFLDEIPYTGKCEQSYPESAQIYLESSYKDGLLDGTSKYYNHDGSVLYMEQYIKGILVKTFYEGS